MYNTCIEVRRKLGVTQRRLAELMNLSGATIAYWETQRTPIPYERKLQLNELLQKPENYNSNPVKDAGSRSQMAVRRLVNMFGDDGIKIVRDALDSIERERATGAAEDAAI